MDDRSYFLLTPSEDEMYLWIHTFRWIIEQNFYAEFLCHKQSFFKKITVMQFHLGTLTSAEKQQITPTPEKLVQRLQNIVNKTKKPLDGDVKTIN